MPSRRALGIAATGALALLAGAGFGTPALWVVGAGLLALPVLATLLVLAGAATLRPERHVTPSRCRAGDRIRVCGQASGPGRRLRLERLLELEVELGIEALGAVRAVRGTPGAVEVPAALRGDHRLGPARLRLADAFLLIRATRAAPGEDRALVLPRRLAVGAAAAALAPERGALRSGGRGWGELDRVRDYQRGDPLSRIHWGQTAKRGRLQTKELRGADGRGSDAILVIDAHADVARAGDAFEAAISAAAGLAAHLARRGDAVVLVAPAGRGRELVRHSGLEAVELALARVRADGEVRLSETLARLSAEPRRGLVIALAVAEDPALGRGLARARGGGEQAAAVLVGPAASQAGMITAAGVPCIAARDESTLARELSGGSVGALLA